MFHRWCMLELLWHYFENALLTLGRTVGHKRTDGKMIPITLSTTLQISENVYLLVKTKNQVI